MVRTTVALLAFALSGCYLEARARGDLFATTSGMTIHGAVLEGEVAAGVQLAIGGRCAATLGVAGVGVAGATSDLAIDHRSTPSLNIGALTPRPDFAPDAVRGLALRFGLLGWMTDTATISVLRLDGGLRFGSRHVELEVGPSLSWWDGGRSGAAVGAGGELAVRLFADPRHLF